MAALKSWVTPGSFSKCFLRLSRKPVRGGAVLSATWSHRIHQSSRLHTVLECHGPTVRTLLGCRQRGRSVCVKAVVVRYNSTQSPHETVTMATPAADTSPPPTLPEASLQPVLTEPGPVLTNPVTDQIPAESLSAAESTPADPVWDPSPVLTNPVTEQIPAESLSAAVSPPADPVWDPSPVLTNPVTEQVADAAAPTAVDVLQAVATEPTFAELGLGANTPVGLIQNFLELIHLNLGLPWWGAIVLGTVVVRLAVFPIMVKGQRETAKMNNIMPDMVRLNNRMSEAKQSGNKFEFAKAYSELEMCQKKHGVNSLKTFLVPFVQAPIFLSFFLALKKMAQLPVPSLQNQGLLWFPDLTVGDPLYILPLAVSGTMFFVLHMGAESGIDNPNLRIMKTFNKIMPIVIFFVSINFPTAVSTYWLTSNCFSILQVSLLKQPQIRKKLNIPDRIIHPPSSMPPQKGFMEALSESWKNAKAAQQMQERDKRIKNHLELSSKGPLRQTFTHNPLQKSAALSTDTKGAAVKAKPWKDTVV